MAATDRPDQLAHLAQLALLARTEKRDHPALLLKALLRRPASLDQLVRMVHLARLVKTAHLVPTEAPVQLATKARLAQLVRPATTALLATKDHPDLTVPRESRVFAPNIAPPTAVSSSKTAQGDKRAREASHRSRCCYADEKPVFFFMSILVVFFIIVVIDGRQPQSSTSTNIIVLDTAASAYPVISFGAF